MALPAKRVRLPPRTDSHCAHANLPTLQPVPVPRPESRARRSQAAPALSCPACAVPVVALGSWGRTK